MESLFIITIMTGFVVQGHKCKWLLDGNIFI